MIEAGITVRELAVQYPQTLGVFDQYAIDYCCGGERRLQEAAEARGVSLAELLAELEAAIARPREMVEGEPEDWSGAALGALADHIERRHHAAMRAWLPETEATLATVARVHAAHHGEMLRPLAGLYATLRREVERHLVMEEQHLFPAIKQCEGRCRTGAAATTWEEELREAIGTAVAEHEGVGAALQEIRLRTNGFSLPEDACPTFARLYRGLESIERDLHRHVHLENNLLFPRALEMTRCREGK